LKTPSIVSYCFEILRYTVSRDDYHFRVLGYSTREKYSKWTHGSQMQYNSRIVWSDHGKQVGIDRDDHLLGFIFWQRQGGVNGTTATTSCIWTCRKHQTISCTTEPWCVSRLGMGVRWLEMFRLVPRDLVFMLTTVVQFCHPNYFQWSRRELQFGIIIWLDCCVKLLLCWVCPFFCSSVAFPGMHDAAYDGRGKTRTAVVDIVFRRFRFSYNNASRSTNPRHDHIATASMISRTSFWNSGRDFTRAYHPTVWLFVRLLPSVQVTSHQAGLWFISKKCRAFQNSHFE
jgi:hypothetical protein